MTRITGTIRNAVGTLSGDLIATFEAPILDRKTQPSTIYLPKNPPFNIVNGIVDINLPATQVEGISCNLSFFTQESTSTITSPDGSLYIGASHKWTDGNFYTGVTHTVQSTLLYVQTVTVPIFEWGFDTLIPEISQVDLWQLVPTGITKDTLPSGARHVADLITSDIAYLSPLIGLLTPYKGAFNSGVFYRTRDLVTIGGSGWISKWAQPHTGNAPYLGSPYWDLFSSKGDPGGTGGDNTAFGASWQNDLNAPSKNTVWTEFNNRATTVQLDLKSPLDSPAFKGAATYLTQSPGAGIASATKTRLATCEYADLAVAASGQVAISQIMICGSTGVPAKYIRLDGRTLSRTTYAALWAIVNGFPEYGNGDGSTTFTVPNWGAVPTHAAYYYAVYTGV